MWKLNYLTCSLWYLWQLVILRVTEVNYAVYHCAFATSSLLSPAWRGSPCFNRRAGMSDIHSICCTWNSNRVLRLVDYTGLTLTPHPTESTQNPQAVWCVETLGVAWPGSFMLMSTTIWTAGESIKPTLNTDLYVSGVNNAIAFDGNYTWTIKKNISALTQLMKPTDLSRLKPGTEGRDATRTLVTPLASLVFEAHLWSSISSHCHTHSL